MGKDWTTFLRGDAEAGKKAIGNLLITKKKRRGNFYSLAERSQTKVFHIRIYLRHKGTSTQILVSYHMNKQAVLRRFASVPCTYSRRASHKANDIFSPSDAVKKKCSFCTASV